MTKDEGTRITSWLATRFPTQDPSWEVPVLQALWLGKGGGGGWGALHVDSLG